MLGRRPTKKTSDRMARAIRSAEGVEHSIAFQLWKDFIWRAKVMTGNYEDLKALADEFVVRADKEVTDPAIREEVKKRFQEMSTRLNEFTVEDPEETNDGI